MKDFLPDNCFVMGKKVAVQVPSKNSIAAETVFSPVQDLVFVCDHYQGLGVQLLEKMIQAMGKKASDVLVLDCSSSTWSEKIPKVNPKIIVCLGNSAQRWFLSNQSAIRGKIKQTSFQGAPLNIVFTHSLEHMLKMPATKKECWLDLQGVMKFLNDPA